MNKNYSKKLVKIMLDTGNEEVIDTKKNWLYQELVKLMDEYALAASCDSKILDRIIKKHKNNKQ